MGTLNIYKGVGEEYESFNFNGSIKEKFPDFDYEHIILLKAGERIEPTYEVQDDDLIFMRFTPGIAVETILAIVGIVTAVLSAGVSIGASIYSSIENQKIQKSLDEAQQKAKDLQSATTQLPFLKGASNQTALGNNIPFTMGSMYFTPYKLVSGFFSIAGDNGVNQYWNAGLVVGYKNQLIQSVSIGNSKIVTSDSSVSCDDGTISYIAPNQIKTFTSGTYYDDNNRLEIRNSGELQLDGLSQKCTATSYSDALSHDYGESAEAVIKQLEENTMSVDVCIKLEGLRKYGSSSWEPQSASFSIEWSNNVDADSPTWNLIESFTVSDNTNKTIRFMKSYNFSASDCFGKDISVRITRTTEKAESNSQEDAYLCFINCWQYDSNKSSSSSLVACKLLENPWRDKTLRLGARIIANDSTKDVLDEINVMTYGQARTFDGTSWSASKVPTRNPASWILEILTSDAHAHSKYEDTEIDLDSLGALYNYCKEQSFYTDGVITADSKKRDIITKILSEVSATMYVNFEGLIDFAIDKKETNPVALLNAQSIKSITVAKSFERVADGKKVTYTDRNSWSVNNAYITKNGETDSQVIYDNNRTIEETALNFVTTFAHAYKIVRKSLAEQELQPRTLTIDVGKEGDYYPLYSLVKVQMKELKQGLSNGVIKGFYTSNNDVVGVQTSDFCDFTDETKRYGMIIQCENKYGKSLSYVEAKGEGVTKNVYFEDYLEYNFEPQIGNIYSFGYLDNDGNFTSVTNTFKIYGLKPASEGWELTVKDYNDAIYESGTIPEYKSNLTLPKTNATSLSAPTYGDINSIAGEYTKVAIAKASKLFNTQLITLYRESSSTLTSDDLPTSDLIYDFSDGSPSWKNPDNVQPLYSNGWTWTYPESASNTVYMTVATVQSQETSGTITPSSWASPIPSGQNGANGMNTYTITLYVRESDAPTYKPSTLTYNFRNGTLTGVRNGWKLSIPDSTESDAPIWEIHATALSETYTDTIEPTEWSDPVKISSDGITKQEVEEIVKENIKDYAETPNVEINYTNVGFAVDSSMKTLKAQEITLTIKVIQLQEELAFNFDTTRLSALLPSGWGYDIDGHNITIKVSEGVKVTSGRFVIPIIYKSYKYSNSIGYVVENEEGEEEEILLGIGDDVLGYAVYFDDDTSYDIGFTYSGIKGGTYLGKFESLEDIPDESSLIIGDYFTWIGENTATTLSQEGSFKQCGIYFYSGDANTWRFEKDDSAEHNSGALSDILSIANADLENNNSEAYEYLDHLTSNSAFINTLVSNEAYIEKLVSKDAFIDNLVASDLLSKVLTIKDDGLIQSETYNDTTGFKLEASGKLTCLNANITGELRATSLKLENLCVIGDKLSIDTNGKITAYDGVFNNIKANGCEIVQGKFTGNYLDCGIMKIYKDSVSSTIYSHSSYSGSTNNDFVTHIAEAFGVSSLMEEYESTKGITTLYGSGTRLFLDNSVELATLTLKIYVSPARYWTILLSGATSSGTSYTVMSGTILSSSTNSSTLNYNYKVSYYESETTLVKFSGLPSNKPGTSGILYTTGDGVLRIS